MGAIRGGTDDVGIYKYFRGECLPVIRLPTYIPHGKFHDYAWQLRFPKIADFAMCCVMQWRRIHLCGRKMASTIIKQLGSTLIK